ncbi:MAG TPA: TIR domain-containing protein [Streptosporangiaceae bacterium]
MQIAAVAMAPDASWAITVSVAGTVRTWGTGVPPRVIRSAVPGDGTQPAAVALAGDRVRVLWANGETIRLHETLKGARPREAQFAAPAPVRALGLSPSGVLAAVACADGSLRTLNAGTGEFGPALATGGRIARAVAVASDTGPVVAVFPDGSVRRYDPAAGTSDMAGAGPGIDLVAVTPDGETVIAAKTDGVLSRLELSRAGPPGESGPVPGRFRLLGTAITAIAVDGGGSRVLAGRADGTLWLHDMAGGPATEFRAAEPAPGSDRPDLRWWESAEAGAITDGGATRSVPAPWNTTDDDVRFTVYRPRAVAPGTWASLLVFAHKTDLVEQPGQPPLDPVEQVEAIARAHFGETPVQTAVEDARSGVSRGARLRITADLPGLACNPASAEFDWREPVHHVVFRVMAGPELAGSVVRGAVRIWCGPLIIGEVSVAIRVVPFLTEAHATQTATETAPRYRKIFPSYSHADATIVDGFAEVVRTFGDQYLRDVVAIRAGERWRERLPELIAEADIFQLFWSSNSMRSPYCQEEWEHALSLRRPLFVRPFYWEDPRPEDRASGLPPVALDALEFVKVSLHTASQGSPSAPGSSRPGGSGQSSWAPPPAPSPGGSATGAYPIPRAGPPGTGPQGAGVPSEPYEETPVPTGAYPGGVPQGPPGAPPARHRASPVAVRRRALAVAVLAAVVALVIVLIWVLAS